MSYERLFNKNIPELEWGYIVTHFVTVFLSLSYFGRCDSAVGDKVAVFWGEHISFETIYALPVDSAFVKACLQDESIAFLPDYSDDCYVTVPDGGDYYDHHNHPSVVNVFPICSNICR